MNRKGFTLIELIATIVLLGIITSISFVSINAVIKKNKVNNCNSLVGNIKTAANEYASDRRYDSEFINSIESYHKEITIDDLIEGHYLSGSIVNPNDKNSTINPQIDIYYNIDYTVNKVIIQNEEGLDICLIEEEVPDNPSGTIDISVDKEGWAREKIVTITYTVNNTINSPKFNYNYSGNSSVVSDNNNVKKIKVTSSGEVNANITTNGNVIVNNSKTINKVDNTGPVVTVVNNEKQVIDNGSVTISLKVTDPSKGIGLKEGSFTKEDIIVKIGEYEVTDFTLTDNQNGNYELKINDLVHNGKVSITIKKDSIQDKLENQNNETPLSVDIEFKNVYTITYNLNGGSVSGNPTTYTNESNNITLKNPTRDGYTFTGWTGSNGTTPQTSVTITKGSTGNKTYTANWKATITNYTITYNLNGGSVSGNPTTYTIESNNITLKNPTRSGYTFTGWTGSNGTTPQTSVTITKGSTGNKTYTANWKAISYTITYNLNGGSVSGNPTTYTIESNNITLKNPTRSGYTFTGWTGSNGTTSQTSVTIAKGSTGNKAYTANWKVNKVYIRFHVNGGTFGKTTASGFSVSNSLITRNGTADFWSQNYGSSFNLPNYNNKDYINITKSGYSASSTKEWCTKSDGTGTCYNQDTDYNSTVFCNASSGDCTVTLYINWKKNRGGNSVRWGSSDSSDNGPCIYDCGCGYYSGGTCGVGCFLAGTKVMTINGYKDIDKIKIGEYVLTYNEKTGNNEYQLVTNQLIHNHNDIIDDLYTLSFDDKTTLKVTSAHRFYINRNGEKMWISANSLNDGDQVMYANHKFHTIINISKAELKDTVYNLTVANNHNYYVGNQKILVHNLK